MKLRAYKKYRDLRLPRRAEARLAMTLPELLNVSCQFSPMVNNAC